MREKEHMKDVKHLGVNYTRAKKRDLWIEHHQPSLTDHAEVFNYNIDWEEVKLLATDSDWSKEV